MSLDLMVFILEIVCPKDHTKKQKRKYIRTIQEISKKPTDDSKIKYVSSDLMEKIIKKL